MSVTANNTGKSDGAKETDQAQPTGDIPRSGGGIGCGFYPRSFARRAARTTPYARCVCFAESGLALQCATISGQFKARTIHCFTTTRTTKAYAVLATGARPIPIYAPG